MKQKINSFFDGVTPAASDKEFLGKVLRKAENMESKKTIRLKPLAIAAAAAAALAVGVTAAGAAGLINFNAVFGGLISTESSALGECLVTGIEDFEYKVSDPDYIIVPNGLTGSKHNYIVSFDIRRADGKPVADYLSKDVFGEQLTANYLYDIVPEDTEKKRNISQGGGIRSVSLNDEGNITVVAESHCSKPLLNSTIRYFASNLYVIDEIIDFRKENNVYPILTDSEGNEITPHFGFEDKSPVLSSTTFCKIDNEYTATHNDHIPADVDDSEIKLLDLDWSFTFKYTLTDTAEETLYGTDVAEKAQEHCGCTLSAIEVSSTGGVLRFTSDDLITNEESNELTAITDDIYLINAEGEKIAARFNGGSGYANAYENSVQVYFSHCNESGGKIALNLDEVAAISVDGIVYSLR